MNKTLFFFVIALILLSFNTVSAQYGYGNGYGYGGYGMGRNSMSQMSQPDTKPKEIPVEVTVGKIMEKLKPELNLDELQTIAIANVYTDIIKSQTAIMKDEKLSQQQKSDEIKALFEVNERKVNEYLNEEQRQKYKALKEERGKDKKDKKKKKKEDE
ncbi:hypothetical protein SAMN05192550_3224 [Flavobacterium glycines]|uniref:DUF4890 domain-containing protein n=1 Tax=Flavobacterium glycines TaxID=551990 RepID=A0A1B9DX65_9FLAO|nr:hypothetical protein [Flavobacterium glycines]OCB74278.1 hypothetical protein FBGL_02405 [Flavobacterium glycines]GEL12208.1 hypothetical protein FGL01_29470 [Flavobacterium glycines]SDK03497.1 hypothetical protein SAMN05192550_3224 [Flavobacterium glycines]